MTRHSSRRRCSVLSETLNRFRVNDGRAVIDEVAQELYKRLDTPTSLMCSILLKYGEVEQLVGLKFDPQRYLEADVCRAADDYQAISFLRKCPLEISGVDRKKSAEKKFFEAEAQCLATNARIRHFRSSCEKFHLPPGDVHKVLTLASRKISDVLGVFDAKAWALRCRFGPGSDDLTQGDRVSGYHKLSFGLSSTPDFLEGAAALVQSHPSWVRSLNGLLPDDHGPVNYRIPIVSTPGNKVAFVPKDALTDRIIAIEPRMNIYAQLGIGALIRSRLKRHLLDLNTQKPSRVLAWEGSIKGTIATIDLSSASDTLARELVRELIPECWYNPMDWCRSKYGYIGDVKVSYEKFSSMGNGFTFELESLIFWALAYSCCTLQGVSTEAVRSFGDDIAVPTEVVPLLEEVLAFCGFTVNTRKSFTSGLFRESCGADFFNGVNIRPFLLKEIPNDASSLYKLANGIRRVSWRRNLGFGCDRRFRPVWLTVVRRLPKSGLALLGPGLTTFDPYGEDIETGDGFLVCNLDEASKSPFVRRDVGWRDGWLYASLLPVARNERSRVDPYIWVYALYSGRDGVATDGSGEGLVSLRGTRRRRLKDGVFTPSWPDLGPWI